MNTTSHAANPQQPGPSLPNSIRPFYWSVRRELWEYRSIYIAPLVGAAVFLLGFLVSVNRFPRVLREGMHDGAKLHDALTSHFEIGAALIMGAAFLASIFYALDTLYGERRDRAILFWKSLPVSDLTSVLAKASIPLLVLPALALAITIVAEAIALLLAGVALTATGGGFVILWTELRPFTTLGMLVYHLVTVHMLWYAPLYAWFLLVSAWSRRAPFVWAFLPALALVGFERVAFHTWYVASFLQERVGGGRESMANMSGNVLDTGMHLTPGLFLMTPGLWIGLACAAAFLWGAARLRRYRGPF